MTSVFRRKVGSSGRAADHKQLATRNQPHADSGIRSFGRYSGRQESDWRVFESLFGFGQACVQPGRTRTGPVLTDISGWTPGRAKFFAACDSFVPTASFRPAMLKVGCHSARSYKRNIRSWFKALDGFPEAIAHAPPAVRATRLPRPFLRDARRSRPPRSHAASCRGRPS